MTVAQVEKQLDELRRLSAELRATVPEVPGVFGMGATAVDGESRHAA
jgi:hypothetical protein